MTYKGTGESLRKSKIKDVLLNFHDKFYQKIKKKTGMTLPSGQMQLM